MKAEQVDIDLLRKFIKQLDLHTVTKKKIMKLIGPIFSLTGEQYKPFQHKLIILVCQPLGAVKT